MDFYRILAKKLLLISAPTKGPQNVHLEDSERGVRVRWTYDDIDGNDCQLQFKITGYDNRKPFTKTVDGNLREYTFPTSGGGEWHLRVQAENQAGSGPQSDLAVLRKTSEGLHLLKKSVLTFFFSRNLELLKNIFDCPQVYYCFYVTILPKRTVQPCLYSK